MNRVDRDSTLAFPKSSNGPPGRNPTNDAMNSNDATIYRDKLTGKKIDLSQRKLEEQEKERKRDERLEKHMEWGRGLVQTRDKKKLMEELDEERNRPFSVYADDTNLNSDLRETSRWGDPLPDSSRPRHHHETAETLDSRQRDGTLYVRPTYRGPTPPPNRFGIMPGYRWDGIDRSNGYENRYFELIASRSAAKEEAYKWSVEDM